MPNQLDSFFIETADNHSIGTSLYQVDKKGHHLIIICPAAGAPQQYYRGFAEFAAQYPEFDAVTFDYRSIGKSRHQPIASSPATMHEWGKQDLETVINWASNKYDKIFLLGHSVAGQIMPYADSSKRISAAYFVASSSAYYGFWTGFPKIKVLLFWHLIIPVTTFIFGYLPGWAMGGNVSLSEDAALEWRTWGLSHDGYLKSDSDAKAKFNSLRIPIHFVSLADDNVFAPAEGIQGLMHRYGNAKTSYQYIRPKDLGLKSISHFGFFRSKYQEKLWSMPLMYFAQHVKKF
ncbi:MAG: alpha/beta fold hydrolase [Cyclobacteriaceae bacterium]